MVRQVGGLVNTPVSPPVKVVESAQTKLKRAAEHIRGGSTMVFLKAPEIEALRYLCGIYRISEEIKKPHPGGHIDGTECREAEGYPLRVVDFEGTVYDVQVLDSETDPRRVSVADTIGCEGMVNGDDPLCAAVAGFFITLPDSDSASNGVYVCRGHLESDFKTEAGARIELPPVRG